MNASNRAAPGLCPGRPERSLRRHSGGRLAARGRALVVALGAAAGAACGPDDGSYAVFDPAPADRGQLPASVTLMLGGDVMVGRDFNDMAERADLSLWSELLPRWAEADVVALNFEGTLTDETEQWPNKTFHFRLEPRHADEVLRGLAPSPSATGPAAYLSLANNHSLDFMRAGSKETREQLRQRGFHTAGTGASAAEASVATVVETAAGVRVGFLSATDHCGCDDLAAWSARGDVEGPWVLRFGRASQRQAAVDEAVRAVARWRDEVDVLVFSLHWGSNWVARDDDQLTWMQGVADALVRAGVDVIHGHSAHHPLPVQTLRGATVAYGPGDLISDYRKYDGFRNDLSYLLEVEIQPDRQQRYRVWPTAIGTRSDGTRHVQPLESGDADHDFVLDQVEPRGWRGLDESS